MKRKGKPMLRRGSWGVLAVAEGEGIPLDARYKPGSGGQLISFVPSLALVLTRQTGKSGDWKFEEYVRRAAAAVLPPVPGA